MEERPDADPDLQQVLAVAPVDEYALAELALHWPDLDGAHARVAAALRLFVITQDPLGWIPDRGEAWATANADGDVLELAAYVLLRVVRRGAAEKASLAATVGRLAEVAVRAGTAQEAILTSGAQPGLAATGRAPRLLETPGETSDFGPPEVRVRSAGWEPVGLGAIQDLVQDAFGPVDLDRSLVVLDRIEPREPACPACLGERFGFPGDLEEARPRMCAPHSATALAVTTARFARARDSNPAGWRALGKASARINGLPEPGGLPLPPRAARAPGRNEPCPCAPFTMRFVLRGPARAAGGRAAERPSSTVSCACCSTCSPARN